MSFAKSSDTVGGLAKLWILPLQEFKGVVFQPGSGLYRLKEAGSSLDPFYFTPDTGGYKVEWKKGAYHITITAKVPGNSVGLDQSLLKLELSPFLVVGLNYNGQTLLFGDALNYFIYDRNQDTGSDFSDLSHYVFELTRQMMIRPRFLLNPFEIFPPVASLVMIEGNPTVGNQVIGTYAFYDPNKLLESVSQLTFYMADNDRGLNRVTIANSNVLTLLAEHGLKYIQFGVLPRNSAGKVGNEVFSAYYQVQEISNEVVHPNNFYSNGQEFDMSQVAPEHYRFQSKDHAAVQGHWQLFSPAQAFDPIVQSDPYKYDSLKLLYFEFELKVNASQFYEVDIWPANYIDPYSGFLSSIKRMIYDRKVVNEWVQVSGNTMSPNPFNSFIMTTTDYLPKLPLDVSFEIRNFKYYTRLG